MIFLESPSTSPQFNLALEEYLFNHMDTAESYFMLWQNKNTVVVGRYQNTAREVNLPFIENNQISVVRRLSGGGAVYHDLGNINFTYITDAPRAAKFDFALFCNPIVQVLRELGVNAEVSGRNDITAEGAKISGNAQYLKRGRILHHGTILYDTHLPTMAGALQVSKDKFQDKGVSSVRSRVANISDFLKEKLPLQAFKERFMQALFAHTPMDRMDLSDWEIDEINQIKQSRYDQWDWNWGTSPKYSIEKNRRFEGVGSITAQIAVDRGLITSYASTGDFFCNGDLEELAQALISVPLEKSALRERLSDVPISLYYNNLTMEDFLSLLVD